MRLCWYYRLTVNARVNATDLPSEIGMLTDLTSFHIWSVTADGGTIPSEFGKCTMLESLMIQGSSIVGPIPTELGQLTKLGRLVLETQGLTGTVPTELGLLTNLNWLSIAMNDFVGELPTELGNVKNLNRLEVHNNDLVGAIPSGLCNDYISIDRSCGITECECCRNPCRKNQ